MRIIILAVILVFIVACGEDSFKKAEMSECLNGTAVVNAIQPKVEITEETDEMAIPDEESDDSDVVSDDLSATAVFLIEKTETKISFYYQKMFVCEGYEYGYDIESDPEDETMLVLDTKARDIWPDKSATCLCSMKMTVGYENSSQDLTKITTIKIVDDNKEKILKF